MPPQCQQGLRALQEDPPCFCPSSRRKSTPSLRTTTTPRTTTTRHTSTALLPHRPLRPPARRETPKAAPTLPQTLPLPPLHLPHITTIIITTHTITTHTITTTPLPHPLRPGHPDSPPLRTTPIPTALAPPTPLQRPNLCDPLMLHLWASPCPTQAQPPPKCSTGSFERLQRRPGPTRRGQEVGWEEEYKRRRMS